MTELVKDSNLKLLEDLDFLKKALEIQKQHEESKSFKKSESWLPKKFYNTDDSLDKPEWENNQSVRTKFTGKRYKTPWETGERKRKDEKKTNSLNKNKFRCNQKNDFEKTPDILEKPKTYSKHNFSRKEGSNEINDTKRDGDYNKYKKPQKENKSYTTNWKNNTTENYHKWGFAKYRKNEATVKYGNEKEFQKPREFRKMKYTNWKENRYNRRDDLNQSKYEDSSRDDPKPWELRKPKHANKGWFNQHETKEQRKHDGKENINPGLYENKKIFHESWKDVKKKKPNWKYNKQYQSKNEESPCDDQKPLEMRKTEHIKKEWDKRDKSKDHIKHDRKENTNPKVYENIENTDPKVFEKEIEFHKSWKNLINKKLSLKYNKQYQTENEEPLSHDQKPLEMRKPELIKKEWDNQDKSIDHRKHVGKENTEAKVDENIETTNPKVDENIENTGPKVDEKDKDFLKSWKDVTNKKPDRKYNKQYQTKNEKSLSDDQKPLEMRKPEHVIKEWDNQDKSKDQRNHDGKENTAPKIYENNEEFRKSWKDTTNKTRNRKYNEQYHSIETSRDNVDKNTKYVVGGDDEKQKHWDTKTTRSTNWKWDKRDSSNLKDRKSRLVGSGWKPHKYEEQNRLKLDNSEQPDVFEKSANYGKTNKFNKTPHNPKFHKHADKKNINPNKSSKRDISPMTMVKRKEWGAPKTKWGIGPPLKLPLKHVFCLPTEKRRCFNQTQCSKELLYLHMRHTRTKTCPDIKYSFFIGSDGTVYECRGWRTRPGLPKQFEKINKISLFIALAGQYDEYNTPRAVVGARDYVIDYGLKHELIDEEYILHSSVDHSTMSASDEGSYLETDDQETIDQEDDDELSFSSSSLNSWESYNSSLEVSEDSLE